MLLCTSLSLYQAFVHPPDWGWLHSSCCNNSCVFHQCFLPWVSCQCSLAHIQNMGFHGNDGAGNDISLAFCNCWINFFVLFSWNREYMPFCFQVPLSLISRWVEKRLGPRWGNMTVWASLILGQPLCIMMYYHDYVVTHFGEALIDSYGHVWSSTHIESAEF